MNTRAALALAAVALAARAEAQDLASRIAAVRDGNVQFTYAVRPGSCDGDRRTHWCGRVVVTRRSGVTESLRIHSRDWPDSELATVNLGRVAAAEAARYLLAQTDHLSDRSAAQAIFGAAMADSVDVRGDLRRIAGDAARDPSLRRDAVLALSGDDMTHDDVAFLEHLFDAGSDELKNTILLTLAHSEAPGTIEWVIRVAGDRREPARVRKQALFWLGQSRDPRATDYLRRMVTQ